MNDDDPFDTDDSQDVLKVRQSLRHFQMLRAIALAVCVAGIIGGAIAFYMIGSHQLAGLYL